MKTDPDYNAIIDFKTNESWTEVKKEVFYEFIFIIILPNLPPYFRLQIMEFYF